MRGAYDDRRKNALGLSLSMQNSAHSQILLRIQDAIEQAEKVFARYTAGKVAAEYKSGCDPVTQADKELDALLRKILLRPGEGWLSEESVDDRTRLNCERAWVVDPLDGTKEFVAGIPEFCISIAFVERGRPVAAAICNPASNETFLGSLDTGVTYNGSPAQVSRTSTLQGATVLASRSEIARGEWEKFQNAPFKIQQMGSVAYKLALVAAGKADATFTLSPKNEWDIAAGAALVLSAGGYVQLLDGSELNCNRERPLVPGLVACGPLLKDELLKFLSSRVQLTAKR